MITDISNIEVLYKRRLVFEKRVLYERVNVVFKHFINLCMHVFESHTVMLL